MLSRSVVSARHDPPDRRPKGSSVHGILQARILEGVAVSFPRGSSWPRDPTRVSCIAGRFFTPSATTWEAPLPLQIITRSWVELPVPYGSPLLVIYFIKSSMYPLIPNTTSSAISEGWAFWTHTCVQFQLHLLRNPGPSSLQSPWKGLLGCVEEAPLDSCSSEVGTEVCPVAACWHHSQRLSRCLES